MGRGKRISYDTKREMFQEVAKGNDVKIVAKAHNVSETGVYNAIYQIENHLYSWDEATEIAGFGNCKSKFAEAAEKLGTKTIERGHTRYYKSSDVYTIQYNNKLNANLPLAKEIEEFEVETPEFGDCYNFPKQVTISEAVNENNLDRIASALERIAEVLENGR